MRIVAEQWNLKDYYNLYQASRLLSKDNKKELGLLIPVDVYAQDPLVAESDEEVALNKIYVTCEPDLMDGPISARIAVVDAEEEPVKWDVDKRRFAISRDGALEPLTRKHIGTPQFRQVNVWAVIQSILDMYEETWILGRSVPWGFEGNRLVVVPHAGVRRNASYVRSSKAIKCYYFHSQGKRIYTCLHHDIIAHETGHAILDGLRPHYLPITSLQTRAFHEFVADLTAIMSSMRNNKLRWAVAARTEGDLSKDSLISSLGEEFGTYAHGRPYLRSALKKVTIAELEGNQDPYAWSQVLTGAMFDILCMMVDRLREEGRTPKDALWRGFDRWRRVALQPLDYLPPVDVQLGDYADAVLRADQVVDPVDADAFRPLMRQIFEKRGLPLSEDLTDRVYFYPFDSHRLSQSRTDAYHFLNENRRQLCIPAGQDITVIDLYQTNKASLEEGKLPREVVVQYIWREPVELQDASFGKLAGNQAALPCGGTLVFDERGNLKSWCHKPGTGKQDVPGRGQMRAYCDQEREMGMSRRQQLLAYLKDQSQQRHIVFAEEIGEEGLVPGSGLLASQDKDGFLQLEAAPEFDHGTAER
jgi:hypothetical protein